MSEIPQSQDVTPDQGNPATETPARNAGFVVTADPVRDKLAEYEAAKAALEAGQDPVITGKLRTPDEGAPTVEVAVTPSSAPAAREPEEPEPQSQARIAAEPEQPAAAPSPEPVSAAGEEPEQANPAQATDEAAEPLPPLPPELGVSSVQEAIERERAILAEMKTALEEWDYEGAETLRKQAESIANAYDLLSAHEQRAEQEAAAIDRQVVALYPDSAKAGTAFADRLVEIWDVWRATGHPAVNQKDGAMQAAHLVAKEQGVAPASTKPRPSSPPPPQPAAKPAAQLSPSLQRQQAPTSPLAALATTGNSPAPVGQKTELETIRSKMKTMDDYMAMKESLLASGKL